MFRHTIRCSSTRDHTPSCTAQDITSAHGSCRESIGTAESYLSATGTADGPGGRVDGAEIIIFTDTIIDGDMMTAGAPVRSWIAVIGPFALNCASMADSVPLSAPMKERA